MTNPNINEKLENTLNEQFPKGKCKERGQALVLFAVAQRIIDNLESKRKYWENKFKKLEGKEDMKTTDEIFDKTIEELNIKEEELYFDDGHLTSLGVVLLTASMIGSGEYKKCK